MTFKTILNMVNKDFKSSLQEDFQRIDLKLKMEQNKTELLKWVAIEAFIFLSILLIGLYFYI